MAAPQAIEGITFETRGPIAIITLNQPKKLNALTQQQFFHISQLLRHIDTRDDLSITVLTGRGRFYSAGADVGGFMERNPPMPGAAASSAPTSGSPNLSVTATGPTDDDYRRMLTGFMAYNLNVTQAFYSHRKILVAAMNGPAVGMSAALLAHADFVYAAPHAYLLVPFTSLGLSAEGLASRALVARMGPARGREALLMSKRIQCHELLACGFVNKVFEVQPGEDEKFLGLVLEEVNARLGTHLVGESLVRIKALMKATETETYDAQGVREVYDGLALYLRGIPQEEFRKVASREKRHKL